MNAVEVFAARRRDRMTTADDELRPLVVSALTQWAKGQPWYEDLVVASSVLWLEIFLEEAPNADPDRFIDAYQALVSDTLAKTSEPSNPPTAEQVQRVTYWLSTMTVNDATFRGNGAHGGRGMRWATMMDDSVRHTHRAANGQIADRDGTFDIGGFDLHYPGEPVGPPEIWINCRCILVSARVEGALTVADPVIAAVESEIEDEEFTAPADDDEMVDDEPEDDEELITEIPVHGVTTVEGHPTGDGRFFERDAISFANLPQPMGFEFESSHGGDNSRVAIVGRIDEFFKFDNGEYVEIRWRGVVFPGKPYASQAIEGILDGSYGGLSIIADTVAVNVEATQLSMDETPEGHQPITHISEARIRRHDMVPTPAYQEAYVALGWEFPDELADGELTPEEALAACGCADGVGPEDDDNPDIVEGYDAFRDVPTKERKRLADEGKAMPDGSFPIANEDDLRNAIQAIGRAKDPASAKRHIRKRARALGKEDLIPEGWASQQTGVIDLADLYPDQELDQYAALFVVEGTTFAPGTKDGPGWITHPIPTARIRRYWVRGKGAAKIRWGVPGDFNRCRRQLAKYVQNPEWLAGLCANMHKEAIGMWPGQEGGGRGRHSTEGITMSLTAAGVTQKPSVAFKDPGLTGPTPTTIEPIDDGLHIYGHLAAWGVCHIGIQDVCTTAPHSATDYAFFRLGAVVTEEGRVPVGKITMGTGHAPLKASMRAALEHYDNTGTAVADIVTGEDQYGIWFSGLIRPTATQDQIDALQASALSGDWRWTAKGLELIAALAVNVPGFPIPRIGLAASGEEGQMSLVAAGIVEQDEALTAGLLASSDEIAAIVRTAVDEYRFQEGRASRIEALGPFAQKARERVRARVTDFFQTEKEN